MIYSHQVNTFSKQWRDNNILNRKGIKNEIKNEIKNSNIESLNVNRVDVLGRFHMYLKSSK